MSIDDLAQNYSYVGDTITFVICITLLILIRWVLYFSVEKRFIYLTRALHFLLIGSIANVLFFLCWERQVEIDAVYYILRDIYHICLFLCMYVFVLYIKHLLGVNNLMAVYVAYFTRALFCVLVVLELLSPVTGFGLNKIDGVWHADTFNPYSIFYVYALVLLGIMLFHYDDRMIRAVRYCLIVTELIIIAIIIMSGLNDSNTFATFTYVLPVVVVLILLHSKPFDAETGTMSSVSFDSYIERTVRKNNPMDYMVLELDMKLDSQLPSELGKALGTFWHKYFNDAMFFSIENGIYVLAIPKVKKNGNIEDKIRELFYEVFPEYYQIYNIQYKMLGLTDIDFIRDSRDIKNIIGYLFGTLEENSTLIIDDELRKRLRIMRTVKEHLEDIDRKADVNDERVLAYCQPVKNVITGKYDTAEALMRLQIPEYGIVAPYLFIPIAEDYGHIHMLTKIMLNKVCKELGQLMPEGYSINRVSVNFAVSEIRDNNFCSDIINIVESNGIDPSLIGVEITESQNENDFNLVKEKISTLKEKGMTIYLDDFGTGYSNLDRILQLGLDVIKYDRSMLLAAEEDEKASFMIQHFAEAFKQFEYKLLFEGVETEAHEELCIGCGAEYLQGFKYSKPVPIEELKNYLEKR